MREEQGKSIAGQSGNKMPVKTTVAIILMMVCSVVLAYFYNVNLCVNTHPYSGCMGCEKIYTECAMIMSPLPLSLLLLSLLLLWKKSRWTWWGCIVVLFINAVSLSLMADARYIDGYAEELYIYIPIILLLVTTFVLLVIDRRRYFEYTSLKRRFERYLRLLALLLFIGFIVYFSAYINSIPCLHPSAYNSVKDDTQNAVTYYQSMHNGSFPTLNSTYTNANCSNCNVINVSALLTANGGMFREAPDGLNLSVSGNDNCGGNSSLGCRDGWSHIWIVDTQGNVFSYCAGTGCTTNNSGYQGVWP